MRCVSPSSGAQISHHKRELWSPNNQCTRASPYDVLTAVRGGLWQITKRKKEKVVKGWPCMTGSNEHDNSLLSVGNQLHGIPPGRHLVNHINLEYIFNFPRIVRHGAKVPRGFLPAAAATLSQRICSTVLFLVIIHQCALLTFRQVSF